MRKELDLGCGVGSSDGFYGRKESVPYFRIGVDNNRKLLAKARKNNPGSNFVLADITSLPFKDNSVDAISATHVLEHLDEAEGRLALSEIARVAKLGAVIRIATPSSFHEGLTKKLAPKEYHIAQGHKRVLSKKQLLLDVEDSGLNIQHAITGKSWFLIKNLVRITANRILKIPMEPHTTILTPNDRLTETLLRIASRIVYPIDLIFLKAEDPTLTRHSYFKLLSPVRLINRFLNKVLPFENYVLATKT